MTQLFGFSIAERKKKSKLISPAPPNNDDGTSVVAAGAYFGQYVDIDGIPKSNNDFELIKKYREIALHPECDSAIDDIINESVASDLDFAPVNIELSNLEASDKVKKQIREEFKFILRLLDFDRKSHDIFRRWYIDGRMFYHKLIDFKKPQEGIKELRYIDALKIKKVREIVKNKDGAAMVTQEGGTSRSYDYGDVVEYYMYFPSGYKTTQAKGLKIADDAITFVASGLMDHNRNMTLSFLHKAIKSVNQLRMIEDSLVIYRISRAPERRIFYIDVGNLPKMKAEQYLREVMNRYRNKLVYDSATGEVKDDRKHMSMLEDFWLPRREGGRGTEITTLPGGQNLGELADIEYFQKKLYRALGVPESRIAADGGFNLGRSSEILRDELKFAKFVGRMRKRFASMFNDMLKTQLILKNIVTPEDWDVMEDHIQYDFLYDNQFAELKETELLEGRLNSLATIEPYIGKYYSTEYVRKKILRQTDTEIIEIDTQIEDEIQKGIIPDPSSLDPITGEPLPQEGDPNMDPNMAADPMSMGEQPMDPDITAQAQAVDAQYQKDTKKAEL